MAGGPDAIADALLAAYRAGEPLPAFPGGQPFDRERGEAVQAAIAARRADEGMAGYKIGLTSPAAQAMFATREPMAGRLYASTAIATPGAVDLAQLCTPKLEGEVMLRVHTRVTDPDTASDEALIASLASVHAAFEIADSRIAGWKVDVGGAIADNACCAHFGLLDDGVDPAAFDWTGTAMTIHADGAEAPLSSGTAGATMGSPLNAYRWLLVHLAARGQCPAPGDLVLTGALGPMVPMERGRTYRIALDGLGTLALSS